MATKLSAVCVTLIGILFLLAQLAPETFSLEAGSWLMWLVSLLVLLVGIGKLQRAFSAHTEASKQAKK
ncbi:MAG: hypothetical protein QW273_01885 [Candidatus Pacearchaeota archaeon]